jgi:hypothetical protein
VAVTIIVIAVWIGDRLAAGVQRKLQQTWRVADCELVNSMGTSTENAKFTLDGPSRIEIIDRDFRGCYLPVGAEFHRDGNYMCEASFKPNVSDPTYSHRCFYIQDETGK